MGTMTIDGRKVEFTDEKNILTVIRNAGINIPTLCYHSEISTFGACRLCTVEDDRGKTFASCSEQPRDGMVIYTNTGRLRNYRKLIVELLLAAHCRDCTTCIKSGECVLQELAHRLGVRNIRFENTREQHELDFSSPSIVRDPNKCILCGNCVRACEEIQGIGALGFAFRGTEAMVMPAFNKKIAETQCVNCGQCRVFCPTGAISIHTNSDKVWKALADPEIRVVAQIAPAVRVAVGDHYGLQKGRSVMGKIVNALHRMGFDEVYDTSFSADLTIMEESAEFLDRIEKGEKLPIAVDGAYMNFSGVETKASRMAESEKCDKFALALGVLENVRDTLVKTINKAMTDTNTHRVLIVGGVASNGIIRNGLTKKLDGDVYFAKAEYSTDNAVGTAYLAHVAHKEA